MPDTVIKKLPGCYTYSMIEITPTIWIEEQDLEFNFIHSSGPGGQNVNKVSSAVQLRFNVRESSSIPVEVKQRLVRLAGKRMTTDEILVIEARQYRSQEKNRQAAQQRLIRLIQQAAVPPKIDERPNLHTHRLPAGLNPNEEEAKLNAYGGIQRLVDKRRLIVCGTSSIPRMFLIYLSYMQ